MKIIKIIRDKQLELFNNRQPVIAFMGDSVTHGCFGLYVENDVIRTYMELEKGYHEKVKEIFRMLYPKVPLTIINAGLSGDKAKGGKNRLDRDVLSFNPDLVVVCYGLNDACDEEAGIEEYISSLNEIFDKIKQHGSEIIFLTPNLRTDELNVKFDNQLLNDCALNVIQNEKQGWLDKYLDSACKLCQKKGVIVCDCNKIWKCLKENDVDINNLLANRINHPVEKMNWLFAYELVKIMFEK